MIGKTWKGLVNWFENADLVPLLVLVSAVHYAAVLAGKDWWPVAVAIGLLVDLGHYRTIRAAVRYGGEKWYQHAIRWGIAIGMTAVSLSYHQRYYMDWWLSAPLPLLIAALAWLQQVEPKKREDAPIMRVHAPASVRIEAHHAEPPKLLPASFDCHAPGCGASFASNQARAAHMRWQHKKAEVEV